MNEESEAQSLLTNDVLDAYYEAVEVFGKEDLVVVLNDEGVVAAYDREEFLGLIRGKPKKLAERITRPAKESLKRLKDYPAFWFVAELPSGEAICAAVAAVTVSPGGDS